MTKKQWRDTWRSVRTIAQDLADDARQIDLLLPSQLTAFRLWNDRKKASEPHKKPEQKLYVEC